MNKITRLVVLGIFMSYVLSFSIALSSIAVLTRYVLFLIIIILEIKDFKLTKDFVNFVFLFLVPFFIYPLLMILLGVYSLATKQILVNILYFLLFFFAVQGVSRYYVKSTGIDGFLNDLKMTIFGILLSFSLIYKGLSFNVITLLQKIISNSRDADERVYLGFTNPNQVAMFAGIGIVCLLFLLFDKSKSKKELIINCLEMIFFVFIIINTGSRTPVFSFLSAGLILFFYEIYKKLPKLIRYSTNVVIFGTVLLAVIKVYLLLENPNSNFLTTLNDLSTNRLNRQISTLYFLYNDKKIFTGYGMFNTSYFNSLPQFRFYQTDSYYTFIIATMGIIGLSLVLLFIFVLFKRTKKHVKSLYIIIFSLIYSGFEATLFFPTSIVTLLLFVVGSIYIQSRERENYKY